MINFTVPGQPQGKGRARSTSAGRHYTPAKTVAYEGLIAHRAHIAMAGQPLMLGAVSCVVNIRCQIPASWSAKKRASAAAGDLLPVTKPDADNVIKAVFDGMNGVVFRDDAQVVTLAVAKLYAETPGVSVTVKALEAA